MALEVKMENIQTGASCQVCGCDFGTTPPHLCERHQLAAIKAKLKWLLDEHTEVPVGRYDQTYNELYNWAVS